MRIRFGTEVFELLTRDRDINEDLLNLATEIELPLNRAAEDFVDWLQQNEFALELPESKLNPPVEDDPVTDMTEQDELLASPISVIIKEMRSIANQVDGSTPEGMQQSNALHTRATRTKNCFQNAELYFVYQVVSRPDSQLLRLKNYGRKSHELVKQALANLGLHTWMGLTPERLKLIKALTRA